MLGHGRSPLGRDGKLVSYHEENKGNVHAEKLTGFIISVMEESSMKLEELDAVAVSSGPGSYTGLRVGLATAKGLCYALNIPLIAISTLKMIAFAAKDEATSMICPMIDARRMEVFTAVFDKELQEKIPAHALIIDEKSFADLLSTSAILFFGNGSKKLQPLILNNNASFSDKVSNASHLSPLSQNCFLKKQFADIAYSEPLYIKEFYSPARKT